MDYRYDMNIKMIKAIKTWRNQYIRDLEGDMTALDNVLKRELSLHNFRNGLPLND